MTAYVYLNGEFLAEDTARISIYDGGWLHGAGVFETMRAENGRIFRLESHLARLKRSAERLFRPISDEDLPKNDVLSALLERNSLENARVRMTISAGSLHPARQGAEPPLTVCITAVALDDYPAELYERGAVVAICRYRVSPDDPIAGHKTTAYLPRLIGLRQAQALHCLEALWSTTENLLAEGSISNVFVAKDDVVRTPPLDTPVLPGIARATVLELAEALDIRAEEASLTIDDLLDADEVFLTNAIVQVLPVVRVEKRDIGTGRPGPLTKWILQEYRNLVQRECGEP